MADGQAAPECVDIEVCYARPGLEIFRALTVPATATLREAVEQSGILGEIGLSRSDCHVGVYGKLKPLETTVRKGDRIEIYRPLIADPKESRRRRAEKKTGR